MKTSVSLALLLGAALLAPGPAQAEQKGQDFPGSKCTCKGCGSNPKGEKVDVTGQCATVCKDKTVYSKGSEPYDYCKAAAKARVPAHRVPKDRPLLRGDHR